MILSRLALAALLTFACPVHAETAAETPQVKTAETAVSVKDLTRAMHFDDLFQVLRQEGLAYGTSLEEESFPSGGGDTWTAAVSAIYDIPRMRADFDRALEGQLAADPKALGEMIAFFESPLGQRVVGLEIEARRAFLDTDAEEAARVAADDAATARDPKVALIRRMIDAADLLEMNVAGSMSGNLAFMTGMSESGVYGQDMPPDQILSDIWAQEDQIRSDTSSWLNAYLGLAYAPLSEAELQTYVAFAESPAGRHLNAALFTAFDRVFGQVSLDLGRAAGRAMQSNDI